MSEGFPPVDVGDQDSAAATIAADAAEVAAYSQADDADAELAASGNAGAEWWTTPYAKGGPVGPAELVRPLYFPDNPAGKPASKDGPDVVALKRTVSRAGRWPWQEFDDSYSTRFALGSSPNVGDSGVQGVQKQEGLEATGQVGDATYQALRRIIVPPGRPHSGELAMDATAVRLLNEAKQAATAPPAGVDDVRAELAAYCLDCLANAGRIHYQQKRPMTILGVAPSQGFTADCSEHATAAYYWPRKVTKVAVPDPNHRGFDGYGYTGTLIGNPEASPPYKVGDLGLYGPNTGATSHVVTCYVAGDRSSSRWLSHGSDDAPYSVELDYRSDLLIVVRPPLMP